MVSLISILALFLLVLSNGYFTLPVLDEEISSSTAGEPLNLRFVDDDETTLLPHIKTKRLTDEHMGFETSNSSTGLSGNKFNNKSLRAFGNLPFATDEPADNVDRKSMRRQLQNSTQIMPIETTTTTNNTFPFISTTVLPAFIVSESSTSTSSPTTSTLSSTSTSSPSTSTFSSTFTSSPSTSTSSPTTSTFSSTSTSSPTTITSTFSSSTSTSLPSTTITSSSTSTEKYIGLLKDDDEYEQSTKPTKIQRKSGVSSRRKSKTNVAYKSKENSYVTTIPTAVFDQQALDKVPNVPNDFLILDESNDFVFTGLPNQTSTTITTASEKEEEDTKPLNQG